MGDWKYIAILVLFLVACAPVLEEQKPVDSGVDKTPVTPVVAVVETAPSDESLGIKSTGGKVAFLSPMMLPGQTATYQISITGDGPAVKSVRSYEVIDFYHNSDPCVGIQRNSTVPGEQNTQTMWCDDVKYLFVWNDKRLSYNTPQVLGRDSPWSEESVQGFSISDSAYAGATKVVVPAGSFWTLYKSVFDGVVKTETWASPQVPGMEAGLVKKVVTEGSMVTTTELMSFSGLDSEK